MQIIYIHTTNIDSHSTSANFVINNVYSLADLHDNVHLFIMNSSSESAEKLIEDKFNYRKPPSLTIHDYHGKEDKHFSFYRFTIRELKRIENNESIVVTRTLGMLPHLFFAGRKVYSKIFFETHDFFYDLSLRNDIKRIKKLKYSLFERLFFKRLDGLICLNKYQKALYEKYIPSLDIKVFPTGLKNQTENNLAQEPYLIYAGSFKESKGFHNIFRLAELLNADHKIWIAGARDDNEKNAALEEVQKRNLSHKIDILPWMSKSDLRAYFSRAKMGLLPVSDTFFNRHLTVPLKLLDYYSYNLPIIATDSALLRDWVIDHETGILVQWDNLERSIEAIEKFLTNEDQYDEMVNNVARMTNQHTWAQRSENQIKYFNSKL
ncbi:MAG: glycosyltransferase [Candidatus Marinimicrobia bacterium]|nr:glycosyltransferase [Candidatus Neomarinimicrobiota bacterium]